jgi:hypothetical protein
MKNLFTRLFLFFNAVSWAQFSLPSVTLQYENQMPVVNGEQLLFNAQMLNILFASKVGTSFSGTNDLSLQRFFASLDAEDNSLSFGVNFDSRLGDELEKLKLIITAGAKIKSENKFAALYESDNFQEDNVGLVFKLSYIGNGTINFTKKEFLDRKMAVLEHRKFLYKKYDDKVDAFNKKELNDFRTQHLLEKQYNYDLGTVGELLMEKSDELYKELAKEEIAYIEKNKLYRYLKDYWFSFDAYVPLGEKMYMTTPNKAATALESKIFYPLELSLTGNYMILFSHGESIFMKWRFGLKNNNNILVDNKKALPFQTTMTGNDGMLIVTESTDGYEIDYDNFVTRSLTLEPAVFILKNTLGFSPSIEFNAGKYSKTNWKLGVPVSLKDKEGKPKVNFEIQWKEINTFNTSNHYIGISTSFLFGDLIN